MVEIEFIGLINKKLSGIFTQKGRVFEAMRYSLNSGGKRIRPLLAMLCADALGGSLDYALTLGCALELIHTYSLIHDDLPAMDNDDLRRGMPTLHMKYDEATAILAGDGLLTESFSLVASAPLPPELAVSAVGILASAAGADGMVGGQALDINNDENADILTVYRKKTGALIDAACSLGAVSAGHDKDYFQEYSKNIALAFQLRDDYLDIHGNPDETGKKVGRDEKNAKENLYTALGGDEAAALIEKYTRSACESIGKLNGKAAPLLDFALRLSGRVK